MAQNRSSAVMAQRVEPDDSLDYFPTPPWATRALCEFLGRRHRVPLGGRSCWEPACGEGHMVRALRDYFTRVHASDVHDYGAPEQQRVCDFLLPWSTPPHIEAAGVDWIITNPPFRLATEFALRAIEVAVWGVALLVRTTFLEGGGRHARLFHPHPPTWILQFCERVPMFAGRLDAKGSSATSYCWVVWTQPTRTTRDPKFCWLPPCRKRLEAPGDYGEPPAAEPAPAPLLEEGL